MALLSMLGSGETHFVGNYRLKVYKGFNYLLSNAKPLRLREMTSLEPQKRLRDPKNVRVDGMGRIFIADHGSYRIQVYQKDFIPLGKEEIFPPLRSPTLDVT